MVRDGWAGWVCSLIVSILWCVYNAVPPYLMLQVRPAAATSPIGVLMVDETYERGCHALPLPGCSHTVSQTGRLKRTSAYAADEDVLTCDSLFRLTMGLYCNNLSHN